MCRAANEIIRSRCTRCVRFVFGVIAVSRNTRFQAASLRPRPNHPRSDGPRREVKSERMVGTIWKAAMQPNAFFPSLDIGTDPAKIRDWAQAAEDLGYAYIEVPDHVFGAKGRDGWVPLYNEKDPFHETFVTLGFLAAVTKTIGLSTGILIAPQRQTGVIAKQAAEVDVLSGGRLRLGIGLGWNHVEYEALGAQWKTRGARQAEQVEVLRRLWSGDVVSFTGRFHHLEGVSIVPPPVQRPIPIWFGGSSDAVVTRAARLGDGWMPIMAPDAQAEQKLGALREQLK